MRPVSQVVAAAVAGPWIPIDYIESWFGVSLFVTLSEDASGITYTVDFTGDDTGTAGERPVSISRTTTVATVTDPGPGAAPYNYSTIAAHGLIVGDSVVIQGSGSANLDGTFAVASTPTPTTYTYTVANSGATSDNGNAKVNALRVFPHTVLTAQTVRNFGTFNYPIRALRLRLSAWAAGQATLTVLQGQPR
jgi:hypothetical protein